MCGFEDLDLDLEYVFVDFNLDHILLLLVVVKE